MKQFGEMGLLGLTTPVEYGGGGANCALRAGRPRVEQVDQLPLGHVGAVVARDAPDLDLRLEERRTWPRGDAVGCFGLTEPTGSTHLAWASAPCGTPRRASGS